MYKRARTSYKPIYRVKQHSGNLHIENREFIGNLNTYSGAMSGGAAVAGGVGPVPFSASDLTGVINPGNIKMFPWLSNIAGNFEKYRFKKLCFYLKSVTSDALSTTGGSAQTLGECMIAIDYNGASTQFTVPAAIGAASTATYSIANGVGGVNSLQAPFANQSDMLNSEGSMMSKPSQHIKFEVDTSKRDAPYKWLFVNYSKNAQQQQADSSIGDYRLYNMGNIMFATQAIPVPASGATPPVYTFITTHQIWIEYIVEFETPILNLLPTAKATYQGTGTSDNTNIFKAPLRTTRGRSAGNQITVTFDTTNSAIINQLEPGLYDVELVLVGSSALVSDINYTLTNCTGAYIDDQTAALTNVAQQCPASGTATTISNFRHRIRVEGQPQTIDITYTVTTVPTGTLLWSWHIQQIQTSSYS